MLRRVGGGEPVLVTDRTSTAHSGDQYYFILPSSRACSGSEGGRVDFSWPPREVWSLGGYARIRGVFTIFDHGVARLRSGSTPLRTLYIDK